MFSFNIISEEAAIRLTRLCKKYHKKMDIDVVHGRYIIDGCSILGVYSLIGHIVTIDPQSGDEILLEQFRNELESIQ